MEIKEVRERLRKWMESAKRWYPFEEIAKGFVEDGYPNFAKFTLELADVFDKINFVLDRQNDLEKSLKKSYRAIDMAANRGQCVGCGAGHFTSSKILSPEEHSENCSLLVLLFDIRKVINDPDLNRCSSVGETYSYDGFDKRLVSRRECHGRCHPGTSVCKSHLLTTDLPSNYSVVKEKTGEK